MPLLNQKVFARRHAWPPQTQALARVGLSLTSEDHPRSSGKGSAKRRKHSIAHEFNRMNRLDLTSTLTMNDEGEEVGEF